MNCLKQRALGKYRGTEAYRRLRFIHCVKEKRPIGTDVSDRLLKVSHIPVSFISLMHAREIFPLRKISTRRSIIKKYDYCRFPNGEHSMVIRDKFLKFATFTVGMQVIDRPFARGERIKSKKCIYGVGQEIYRQQENIVTPNISRLNSRKFSSIF